MVDHSVNAADIALFIAGFVSWTISSLAAGGGSMVMAAAVAPGTHDRVIRPCRSRG